MIFFEICDERLPGLASLLLCSFWSDSLPTPGGEEFLFMGCLTGKIAELQFQYARKTFLRAVGCHIYTRPRRRGDGPVSAHATCRSSLLQVRRTMSLCSTVGTKQDNVSQLLPVQ